MEKGSKKPTISKSVKNTKKKLRQPLRKATLNGNKSNSNRNESETLSEEIGAVENNVLDKKNCSSESEPDDSDK